MCCNTLQHRVMQESCHRYEGDTVTHCNTLQHTVTHCNTLQHTATLCNTLQHSATLCNTLQHRVMQESCHRCEGDTATHCNTPQRTATHCNTLQHRVMQESCHRCSGDTPAVVYVYHVNAMLYHIYIRSRVAHMKESGHAY